MGKVPLEMAGTRPHQKKPSLRCHDAVSDQMPLGSLLCFTEDSVEQRILEDAVQEWPRCEPITKKTAGQAKDAGGRKKRVDR